MRDLAQLDTPTQLSDLAVVFQLLLQQVEDVVNQFVGFLWVILQLVAGPQAQAKIRYNQKLLVLEQIALFGKVLKVELLVTVLVVVSCIINALVRSEARFGLVPNNDHTPWVELGTTWTCISFANCFVQDSQELLINNVGPQLVLQHDDDYPKLVTEPVESVKGINPDRNRYFGITKSWGVNQVAVEGLRIGHVKLLCCPRQAIGDPKQAIVLTDVVIWTFVQRAKTSGLARARLPENSNCLGHVSAFFWFVFLNHVISQIYK